MAPSTAVGSPKQSSRADEVTIAPCGSKPTRESNDAGFEDMELAEAGYRLYKFGDFHDLEIKCRGRVFKVHKAIMAQRCPFFRTVASGHFKEGQTSCLITDIDDPDALELLIIYLYTKQCRMEYLADHSKALSFALEVVKIADKYCLPKLTKLATEQAWLPLCILIPKTSMKENKKLFAGLTDVLYPEDCEVCEAVESLKQNGVIRLFAGCYTANKAMKDMMRSFVLESPNFARDLLDAVAEGVGECAEAPRV